MKLNEPEPDGSFHSSDMDSQITVESSEERRIRYLAFPMEECSDPEYWQSLHHYVESSESDSEGEA